MSDLLNFQRVSTPFLPAETQLKHTKEFFDPKFDFEESGCFGTKKNLQKNKYQVSWNVAETQLKPWLKRDLHLQKSHSFRRRMWISVAHGELPAPTSWQIDSEDPEIWLKQGAHPPDFLRKDTPWFYCRNHTLMSIDNLKVAPVKHGESTLIWSLNRAFLVFYFSNL